MKPPTNDFAPLVASIIRERPGITFDALAISTSIWPEDLAKITLQLRDMRIIEHVDGGFRIRTRKAKPPLGRRAMLKTWLREQLR